MPSSYSSLITDDCTYDEINAILSPKAKAHRRTFQLRNIVIFIITLKKSDETRLEKKYSIDVPLLSYSFLVRLINRSFNLHSNYRIQTKTDIVLKDDFDFDDYLTNNQHENVYELNLSQYDTDDWYIVDEEFDDNFQLIQLENNCYLVTIKSSINQQRGTLLRRATNWFHGSVSRTCLTKKEFEQMFEPSTGRLLNEQTFRQRIYETGCEKPIRKIVWCYLFRIFDQTMTNDEKKQYVNKAKERYDEMKYAWQSKNETEIMMLKNLIEKDVTRTDSSEKFFDKKHELSREKLLNILMTYCVYHPEPGYAQGMTDMAAPILYVIRDEALAYACFCSLMRYMSPLFDSNNQAINRRLDLLRKTIKAIDIDLWKRIEECDISNLMFAYRWILLDCKREFPFKDIFSVFECLWASLPMDEFELNHNSDSDIDDLYPTSTFLDRQSSADSSITNTILSSYSHLSTQDENQSDYSSLDGCDSGYYRDEQIETTITTDFNRLLPRADHYSVVQCISLEKWLENFAYNENENHYSDMFTIFLCVALLEQNRTSIMQISTYNVDNDDYIGFYFTHHVRKNDAKQALNLARHYHRQYLSFQSRVRQLLLLTNN